jgi:hypothetical protein
MRNFDPISFYFWDGLGKFLRRFIRILRLSAYILRLCQLIVVARLCNIRLWLARKRVR